MRRVLLLVAVLAPIVFAPSQGSAQSIEAGKWTGFAIDPGGTRVDVVYDVTLKGDTIGITATAGEHGSFQFNEVKLVAKTLMFWFVPGPRVECRLDRGDDGSFSGQCRDSEGGIAQMTMLPPKKG